MNYQRKRPKAGRSIARARALRRRGATQPKIAKEMGVSIPTVRSWCNEKAGTACQGRPRKLTTEMLNSLQTKLLEGPGHQATTPTAGVSPRFKSYSSNAFRFPTIRDTFRSSYGICEFV